jgi:hypothetical protein
VASNAAVTNLVGIMNTSSKSSLDLNKFKCDCPDTLLNVRKYYAR